MKLIISHIVIIGYVLLCSLASAQADPCIADAGPDVVVCESEDSVQIGASVSVQGGIPPYTYAWEANVYDSFPLMDMFFHRTASDFLNDTTLANPFTYPKQSRSIMFVLHVTDSVGNMCHDTMHIVYSHFVFHLGQESHTIAKGDTIESLFGPYAISPHVPNTYLWRPNKGLIDSTSGNFIAAPEETTVYYQYITDSLGCTVQQGSVPVEVSPVSLDDNSKQDNPKVKVYPNPVTNRILFELPEKQYSYVRISIYDTYGRELKSITTKSSRPELDTDNWPTGIYMFEVHIPETGMRERGRFIVE